MGIISHIGRKHPRTRALYLCIYTLLIVGSLSMLYPFILMVAGSMRSAVDQREKNPLPSFLWDDAMLYRKHIEGLFNESLTAMRIAHDIDFISFEKVEIPDKVNHKYVSLWHEFLQSDALDNTAYTLGYIRTPVSRTVPGLLRKFKNYLQQIYNNEINKLNHKLETEFVGWNSLYVVPENYLLRRNKPQLTPYSSAFNDYKQNQALGYRYYFLANGFYKRQFLRNQYTRNIEEYNRNHNTAYEDYNQISLTHRLPAGTAQEKNEWERFVRSNLNLLWVRVDTAALEIYQKYLQAKYESISVLNRNYQTKYKNFNEIPLVDNSPEHGLEYSDWASFVMGWKNPLSGEIFRPEASQLKINSVEFMFQDYITEKYGDIKNANSVLGTTVKEFKEFWPPQREAHYTWFLENRWALRTEFISRNFKAVIDYMVLHGRGILNTAIYCTLAVLFALLVNPLAAYAMSRYRMPATYKILLLMLITMSFPPMLTQIPVFLMLRDFKLLNTFAALLLPGLANGYSIFLLKGFFDSLPRELYESAAIDGAGEWTMFWKITMSLSRPILAVIALQAFTIAYANFMFALLICQDEKMWTLMVWLYQLQQRSGQGVVYASLLIAAIPTFAIFIFCQKIIMRGIVVPVER